MIILAGRYSICQPRIHNRDRQSLQSLCYSRRRKNLHRWGFLYTRIHSHTCGCLHIFETRSWWMAVWRMMIRKQERCCCCFSLFYPEATTVDNRQQSHKKEMRAAVVGCLKKLQVALCVCVACASATTIYLCFSHWFELRTLFLRKRVARSCQILLSILSVE